MSEDLSHKLEKFQNALQEFVRRLEEDRNILAAVLVGSISDAVIWHKESIGLWLIEKDGVTKRLRSDGEDVDLFRTLVEDGINIHAMLIPRSRFKQMVEGSSRTAFSCNFFAERELVYCSDASIEKWFTQAQDIATKDQEKELLATVTWTIHSHRYAQKVFEIQEDLELTKQAIVCAAYSLAALEIILMGEVYEEEIIYKAIEQNPELFQIVYLDVITKRKTKKLFRTALERIDQYLDEHGEKYLQPMLKFLKKEQRVVPLSELSDQFAFTQLYPWHLESACEWLQRKGRLEKLATPFKLTTKSRVDVEEPAYFYDA